MFVGHLAVAFGAKRLDPRVPLGSAVAAAFGLDLLWPILLLLGAESVRVQPGDTAFTSLSFVSYPWSHSLLTAAVWSGFVVVVGWRLYGSGWVAAVLGSVVFSHWVLDAVTHRPDLPVWPAGPVVGLGLWNSILGTIVVEGGLLVAGLWLYLTSSRSRDRIGRWALVALVAFSSLLWISQPWSPPPPSEQAVAWGSLILWLLPPWARWIERHRA